MNLRRVNQWLARRPGLNRIHLERPADHWMLHPGLVKNADGMVEAYHFGERILDWLRLHAGLGPDTDVLDAGCGDGRVASALARSGHRGRYYGYDVNRRRIEGLKRLFRTKENFRFDFADVRHSYYHPHGRIDPAEFTFPYQDGVVDLAFFNSIFTHMRSTVIRRHLAECRRCLRPGGRLWASFFIPDRYVDPDYPKLRWRFTTPWDDGYTATPDNPEKCVAYDYDTAVELLAAEGFSLERYRPGTWKSAPQSLDQPIQDVLVARK